MTEKELSEYKFDQLEKRLDRVEDDIKDRDNEYGRRFEEIKVQNAIMNQVINGLSNKQDDHYLQMKNGFNRVDNQFEKVQDEQKATRKEIIEVKDLIDTKFDEMREEKNKELAEELGKLKTVIIAGFGALAAFGALVYGFVSKFAGN